MATKKTKKSAKKVVKKAAKTTPSRRVVKKPKLLAGGNPQIAKGDGNKPVQEYIKAIPSAWKQDIARKLDALISKTAPKANKAVKWNSPFYGMDGKGWFLSFHCFTRYVKVTFFKGGSLKPLPPGEAKYPAVRHLDIYEGDKIDKQLEKWIKQASKIPGWIP